MAGELFKPVPSHLVDGFTHSEIQGNLATTVRNPFREGHIPQFCCVSLNPNESKTTSESTLRQLSPLHCRSYEFVFGEGGALIWEDEYGNIFTQLNTKGNNCGPLLGAFLDELSPSGFLFYGLQDSESLARVLQVSNLLRSRNIDTEAIVKVIEPAELSHEGKNISLSEFKKKLVRQVWERNAREYELNEENNRRLVPRSQIPELSLALDKMTFFFTIRGVQVTERLADLICVTTEGEFLQILANAFRFVNLDEIVKAQKDKDYHPENFSTTNPGDIDRYFNEYLPKRMARNFAGLHKLGLIHVYPHSGNISMTGSLFDLDSVRGEPLGLGDRPVSQLDQTTEIRSFLNDVETLNSIIKKHVPTFSFDGFSIILMKHYFEEMGWKTGEAADADLKMRILGHNHPDPRALHRYINESWGSDLFSLIDPGDIVIFLEKELPTPGSDESETDERQGRALFTAAMEDIIENFLIQSYSEANPKMPRNIDAARIIAGSLKLISNALTQWQIEAGPQSMGAAILKLARYKSLDDFRYPLYRKLAKHWGWEEDIVRHAWGIGALFKNFETFSTLDLREYYLTKLSEQLGWDFNLSENQEKLINMFHEKDQELARERLERAFADQSGESKPEEIIETALRGINFKENFTQDHSGRYFGFVIEYVEAKFKEQRAKELAYLRKEYGDERAEIIAEWFQQRYGDRFIDALPDDIIEEIERVSGARIETIKAEYKRERDPEKIKQL